MSAPFEAVDALDFPPAPVTKVRKPVGALLAGKEGFPWVSCSPSLTGGFRHYYSAVVDFQAKGNLVLISKPLPRYDIPSLRVRV